MIGYGAGMSCGTWPLCGGGILPDHAAQIVHAAHRYIAAAGGVLIIGTVIAVWNQASGDLAKKWSAAVLAVAFGVQVAMGAAMVWTDFHDGMRGLHLGLATLVWLALVVLALLVLPMNQLRIGSTLRKGRRISKPSEATP